MHNTISHIAKTAGHAALVLTVIAASIGAAGCSRNAPAGPKAQSYSRDGLLGTTDAYPNLPTNPTYHTYAQDRKMMRTALANVQGVADSTIVLNGPYAYVRLKLARGLTAAQAQQVRQAAQDALTRSMPRYKVQVSLQ